MMSNRTHTRLRQFLITHFNLDELHSLCQDIDVDFDELPAGGKGAKARELISHLERRNDLGWLVEEIQKTRPKAWQNSNLQDIPSLSVRYVLPPGGNNLPPLSKFFVGRKSEIILLKNKFNKPKSLITLVGLGGIGKTSLAIAAIQELMNEGRLEDGVFWVNGHQHANLGALVMVLGELMHLDLSKRTLPEQRQVINYLLTGKDALVVFDNFESVAESGAIVDFLRGLSCDVLITSRVQSPEFEDHLIINSLNDKEAIELFVAVSGNESFMNDAEAKAICGIDLEGHPLAIETISAMVAVGMNPTDLRQHLRQTPFEVLGANIDLLETKSVVRALSLSYHRLTPAAQIVLTCASIFSLEFNLDKLAALVSDLSRLTLVKAIQELQNRSLIQTIGSAMYRLHMVTRQFAYGMLKDPPIYHRRAAAYFMTEQGNDSLASVRQFLQAGDNTEAAVLVPINIEQWINGGHASEALKILRIFSLDS